MSFDGLGTRMKKYESITKQFLIPKMYNIIRLDGKAFHTFTRGLERPFCDKLKNTFEQSLLTTHKELHGSILGYHQSDEISILFTDIGKNETQLVFDGNIQKIISTTCSCLTAEFISNYYKNFGQLRIANFDARVFQLPNESEVINYFRWRQQDAVRNSVSSQAQSMYSHKELHTKCQKVQLDMILEKGLNWNDLDYWKKRGSFSYKNEIIDLDLRGEIGWNNIQNCIQNSINLRLI